MSTATLERPTEQASEQEMAAPYVTILRKIYGTYRWVTVRESELTEDERRAQYVAMFSIYE